MKPWKILVGALAIALPTRPSWAEQCTSCEPERLCDPHLIAESRAIGVLYDEATKASKWKLRRAYDAIAELVEDHDNAPSQRAAQVLVGGLKSTDKVVAKRCRQSLPSQHAETAIQGLTTRLDELTARIRGFIEEPDETPGLEQDRVLQEGSTICRLLARAPDDRSATSVTDFFVATQAFGPIRTVMQSGMGKRPVEVMLSFGRRDGFEAATKSLERRDTILGEVKENPFARMDSAEVLWWTGIAWHFQLAHSEGPDLLTAKWPGRDARTWMNSQGEGLPESIGTFEGLVFQPETKTTPRIGGVTRKEGAESTRGDSEKD